MKKGSKRVLFNEGEARRLHEEGMSYVNIAKRIGGVSWAAIYQRLNPKQRDKHNERNKKITKDKKKRLIEYKGGKCCLCGYDKCHTSLSFHHLRPEDKSFGIGNRKFAPLEELLKETDKTILVCNNCHGEVHEGLHGEFINKLLHELKCNKA